jgi:hypothetical protein
MEIEASPPAPGTQREVKTFSWPEEPGPASSNLAGLVDEMDINLAPVLLGQGEGLLKAWEMICTDSSWWVQLQHRR